MKEIGNTKDGNVLVEMNRNEYQEFVKLQAAVTGSAGLPDLAARGYEYMPEFDFSNVFSIIRFYYSKRFLIEQLQGLLNEMKTQLEKTK